MIWFLLAFVPSPVVIDDVDIVELNHIICPTNGNEQGAYWVWWRWQTIDGRADYHVCDWRKMADVPRPVNGVQVWTEKVRNTVCGLYECKVNRRVESKVFHETWTYYDRESEDRSRLPESRRRKLRAR